MVELVGPELPGAQQQEGEEEATHPGSLLPGAEPPGLAAGPGGPHGCWPDIRALCTVLGMHIVSLGGARWPLLLVGLVGLDNRVDLVGRVDLVHLDNLVDLQDPQDPDTRLDLWDLVDLQDLARQVDPLDL